MYFLNFNIFQVFFVNKSEIEEDNENYAKDSTPEKLQNSYDFETIGVNLTNWDMWDLFSAAIIFFSDQKKLFNVTGYFLKKMNKFYSFIYESFF